MYFFFRILCDYSSEICVAALFGREVKIQDGEKDEFAEATKRAFVAEEGDVLTILKLLIIQSQLLSLTKTNDLLKILRVPEQCHFINGIAQL